ncbi:MAG: polyphosphate kinase 1 [Oscillospiraceae bacterium]|jgi:polyphosphate kinase|nr:polyphosphate kinase 1 [Oscillospiraceae bacterium]
MKQKNFKFLYSNRDLSWLDFNTRVLEQTLRNDRTIADKLDFLAISASNLDEFFMVRVASVLSAIKNNYTSSDFSGFTPKEQIAKIFSKIREFLKKQYKIFLKEILKSLEKEKIFFMKPEELKNKDFKKVNNYFNNTLYPVLTPLAVDKTRPFPALENKSLNIVVKLKKGKKSEFKILKIPKILPRFLKINDEKQKKIIMLEDVIIKNLSKLFKDYEIQLASVFRITRDAGFDINKPSEDLALEIKKSIKKRNRGALVKLEISKKSDYKTTKFLRDVLKIKKYQTFKIEGPIDLTFLFDFSKIDELRTLKLLPTLPTDPPSEFCKYKDIFKAIKKQDRLLFHPFESFNPVINFLKQAAKDKNVLAIKQTLYRVSNNSPIVDALMRSAKNGKQVTVLVELQARFDEENNIAWAKKLEQSGCHVIYGASGLKTHCKILLVVRKEKNKIKRYVHFSTGNYNEATAKTYTDISFFTKKESFVKDASLLFNSLTSGLEKTKYKKLVVSPFDLRLFLKKMIKNEIKNKKKGLPASIVIKVNSLSDYKIIKEFYNASNQGVNVQLIVRGICCLVPGIKGLSENITVTSIVGQCLEHSRIFKFENNKNPKIFLGSADLMPRNLDKRVEILFPIESKIMKKRILNLLEIILKDSANSKIKTSNSGYKIKFHKKNKALNSHTELSKISKKDFLKK